MIRRLLCMGAIIAATLVPLAQIEAAPPRTATRAAPVKLAPWTYAIKGGWFQQADPKIPAPDQVLRGIRQTKADFTGLGAADIPAKLRASPNPFFVRVEVAVTLTPDDRLIDCAPSEIVRLEQRGGRIVSEELQLPKVSAAACRLVLAHTAFRHGIDRSGTAFGGRLLVSIVFERWREGPDGRVWTVAAPPPVGPRGGWPTAELPYRQRALIIPLWADFLPDAKRLPRPLTVGVVVSSDRYGNVTACNVERPSANPDFDRAACAAMLATPQGSNGGFMDRYPVMIHWNGSAADFLPIRRPAGPVATNNGRLPDAAVSPALGDNDGKVGVMLELDRTGAVLGCTIETSSMNDAIDLASCNEITRTVQFRPAIDIFGEPIGGRYAFKLDWRDQTIRPQQVW